MDGDRRYGFTLIEVLIAVAVLTTVLLSVYATFFSIHRAVALSDGNVLKLREVRTFFDIIRREVEGSFVSSRDENTMFRIRDRDIFGIRASELSFTTFAPYGEGLYYVEYGLDSKGMVLVKRVAGLWRGAMPEDVPVLDGVQGFEVKALNNGKWVGTYDTAFTGRLPGAVRVSLTVLLKGQPVTLEETLLPKLRGG